MYKRPIFQKLVERVHEKRAFIQVLAGPRQVGKTTLAHQLADSISFPFHYASADEPTLRDTLWIEQQWEIARRRAQQSQQPEGSLLVLDEVQKIPRWSDTVKILWDQDTAQNLNLKVMVLGSSTLLIQTGLAESLTGRFERISISHWTYKECREAFGWSLEQYIYFGGYPGAATLIDNEERWSRYIIDSIIETSLSRDIMLMTRIHKPALLRRLFELGCKCSGSILSYQQMLGQLQDAGNATTLAHYLELLSSAGLITGLQKFSPLQLRQKVSSPKLQVLNTALTTAQSHLTFKEAQENKEIWKRLEECAIGAHLLTSSLETKLEIFYWKDGSKEIDFVIREGDKLTTIEIERFQKKRSLEAIKHFSDLYNPQRHLVIGDQGIPIEEFLLASLEEWI